MECKIKIPIKPLSINAAFQGRRFKTRKCKQYEKDISYYLPKNKKISGNVVIQYRFYLKYFKTTDIDNLIKILQDCLVQHGIIDDDRFIVAYVVNKHPSDRDGIEIDISSETRKVSIDV
jgi:Holliday junction resolvase RusA-like endonuclease